MGKRSNFERRERDFYPTPERAVMALIDHIPFVHSFSEPCAGDGTLIDHLEARGYLCCQASDIEPRRCDIGQLDALELNADHVKGADAIVTNPPWDRNLLHPMIDHFAALKPTWLLFDADWAHTKQARPYLTKCVTIISVGRLKWIKDSPHTGKDNCAWYLFDQKRQGCETKFIGA